MALRGGGEPDIFKRDSPASFVAIQGYAFDVVSNIDVLAVATLSGTERRTVQRLVASLRDALGHDLRAVWLFGSRARGDAILDETDPDRHSDIDLIVIADGGKPRYDATVYDIAYDIALQEGDNPASYSLFVHDPEWLRGRREVDSFFIQEVDRDKLVLAGSDLR